MILKIKREGCIKLVDCCASGEEPYSFLLLWKEKFGKKIFANPSCNLSHGILMRSFLRGQRRGKYKKTI